ncbi:MAG: GDYXXLXY domain-containing protein [Cyanobacteria bacterium P01_F01_bin.42]
MTSQKKYPAWKFWVPMLMQTAIIIAVPLQSAVIYTTGREVTLKTAPVDPYDLLRGYSQTLRYEISDTETLSKLPGGKDIFKDNFDAKSPSVYVVLKAPAADAAPWEPIRVSRDRPRSLPDNQVALKGSHRGWRVVYGLETYYMPEKQRNQINQEIRDVQRDESQQFLVDIKVNDRGKSVPVSLWVGDRKYQF